MKRKGAISVALIAAWFSYGLVMLSLADQEAQHCHQFGEMAAECARPFVYFFGTISIAFLVSTIVLAVLAWRVSSKSEQA